MESSLPISRNSNILAKDVLRDFQLFILSFALILTSVGMAIDILQNLDAFDWLIENRNRNSFVLYLHSTSMVLINSLVILVFLYLVYLLKKRKVSIVKSAVIYETALSIAILIPYFWEVSDQESVVGHLARDIVLYTMSLFVVSTCTFGKYVIQAAIFAIALCLAVSLISKNSFLLVNIPLFIFMLFTFSFALWKKDTLLKMIVNKQSEEKAKIEELSLFKEKMNSMLFHDIKVPLNAIIKQANATPEEPSKTQICLQAENIKRMLSNMLDIASTSDTQISLSKAEFDLSDLLEKVAHESLYSYYGKDIKIDYSFNVKGVKLFADRDLIERALINVIDNAVKYSPSNGRISMNLVTENKLLTIRIKDQGPGIKEEEQEDIFKLFYSSRIQKDIPKSSGIGLAFCKMVAEVHKGSIEVNSPKKGGSEFIFTLPIVKSKTQTITNKRLNFKRQYSEELRNEISHILPKLKELDYFRTSEIYTLLSNVSLKTIDKQTELEEIKTKALSCNQESYTDLINQLS